MKADLDDFRRLYSSLNDEALLNIDRDELVPVAQQVYDAELSSRDLDVLVEEDEAVPMQNPLGENPVVIATFDSPSEAGAARSLLRMAEIPCMLSTDLPGSDIFRSSSHVDLYVPPEFVDQANEVLDSEISEEDLAAQAEAAALLEEELEEEEAEEETEPQE